MSTSDSSSHMQSQLILIRHHKVFEFVVIAVIVFSALVIGAKTYNIDPLALRIIG